MDAKKFYDTVKKMREAQRLYFKTRSPSALEESRRLERTIDEEIQRVERIIYDRQNPKFDFGE